MSSNPSLSLNPLLGTWASGRMDRWTHDYGYYRAIIASHGIKLVVNCTEQVGGCL